MATTKLFISSSVQIANGGQRIRPEFHSHPKLPHICQFVQDF